MSNARSPWTTLSSRRLCENGWVAFDGALVRDPIGQVSSYATVDCKRRSVAIVPIDAEGFTYLVGYCFGGLPPRVAITHWHWCFNSILVNLYMLLEGWAHLWLGPDAYMAVHFAGDLNAHRK